MVSGLLIVFDELMQSIGLPSVLQFVKIHAFEPVTFPLRLIAPEAGSSPTAEAPGIRLTAGNVILDYHPKIFDAVSRVVSSPAPVIVPLAVPEAKSAVMFRIPEL